ncbi:Hypothetical predicted protein [Octopus vulgaris]|uniref:Uncharacterized protein n=1 Tax=Octopus vulgaris TaxID=6645 RepID=A0AA36B1N5_OCTVU|nr:Hypothetical predicted protein [Octopus vulgaris]
MPSSISARQQPATHVTTHRSFHWIADIHYRRRQHLNVPVQVRSLEFTASLKNKTYPNHKRDRLNAADSYSF